MTFMFVRMRLVCRDNAFTQYITRGGMSETTVPSSETLLKLHTKQTTSPRKQIKSVFQMMILERRWCSSVMHILRHKLSI